MNFLLWKFGLFQDDKAGHEVSLEIGCFVSPVDLDADHRDESSLNVVISPPVCDAEMKSLDLVLVPAQERTTL